MTVPKHTTFEAKWLFPGLGWVILAVVPDCATPGSMLIRGWTMSGDQDTSFVWATHTTDADARLALATLTPTQVFDRTCLLIGYCP